MAQFGQHLDVFPSMHVGSHVVCCVQVLKWSDCCLPLACSPDQPFRAVAQASIDDFTRLGVAFIEGRLQLDDGLVPLKIVRTFPFIAFIPSPVTPAGSLNIVVASSILTTRKSLFPFELLSL